jgi:predicted transposase YbfD/YdcC
MELEKHFKGLRDFRVLGRCLYLLSDILVLVLCGFLADCSDFSEIEDYGKDKIDFMRDELGLPLKNGIPSEDTLDRVFRHLEKEELEKSLRSCAQEIISCVDKEHLCIDGKVLRGSIKHGKESESVHLVSVWLSSEKLSFSQVQVASKSNEITAIPELLENINCQGATITIDAIACQHEITEKIIKKKANYLIALKANQGDLFEQVKNWLISRKSSLSSFQEMDKDHNRGEIRNTYVCQDLQLLEETHSWCGLRTIVMTESTRIIEGQQTTTNRFYISSLSGIEPQEYAKLIRGHWGIENGLHWHLDVTFREDQSMVWKDHGPANLSIVRKFALFLLAKEPSKISIKRKRKKAARDPEFLKKIINYA